MLHNSFHSTSTPGQLESKRLLSKMRLPQSLDLNKPHRRCVQIPPVMLRWNLCPELCSVSEVFVYSAPPIHVHIDFFETTSFILVSFV